MSIFFLDSMAHYTTQEQVFTKVTRANAPAAGQGAFAQPGIENEYRVSCLSPLTTIEVSAYWKPTTTGVSRTLSFYDALNVSLITIHLWFDGHLEVYRGNGGGGTTLLYSTGPSVVSHNIQHHVYCQVVFDGAVGSVLYKLDQVTLVNLVNVDTNSNSVSGTLTHLDLGELNGRWSHLALASAAGDLPGMPRVGAVFATATSTDTGLTQVGGGGAQHTAINETTPDDATYLESTVAGDKSSFEFANHLPTMSRILAIATNPRVYRAGASLHTGRSFFKIAGVDYPLPTKALPASPAYLQDVTQLNPATGVEFTPADVNAPLIAGFEVVT